MAEATLVIASVVGLQLTGPAVLEHQALVAVFNFYRAIPLESHCCTDDG